MQVRITHFQTCGLRNRSNLWLRAGLWRSGSTKAAIAAAVIVIACAHAAIAQIPCSYEIAAIIQAPPCGTSDSQTVGSAISPNGRWVVGHHACPLGGFRAFVFDSHNGNFTTIHPAGMFTSHANDVNDAGIVVGFMGGTSGDFGFVYDAVAGQLLHTLTSDSPGGVCEATGINNANIVCGTRSINDGGDPVEPRTAFRWSAAEGFTDLGLIDGFGNRAVKINGANHSAVILGAGIAAYLWTERGATLLPMIPGADDMIPRDIGSAGEIVGWSLVIAPSQLIFLPFRVVQGSTAILPRLGGATSSAAASAINASGLIVGNWSTDGNTWRPCAWRGEQVVDIQSRVKGELPFALTNAASVSDSGAIVCNGSQGIVLLMPSPTMTGDINCDGLVNVTDLLAVIGAWGACTACAADINGDDVVNHLDLIAVIVNWSF